MSSSAGSLALSLDLPALPADVFEAVLDGLRHGLADFDIAFDISPDGRLVQSGMPGAHVTAWQPGSRMDLEWQPAEWAPAVAARVSIGCAAIELGTHLSVELSGLPGVIDDPSELAAWFAGQALAPALAAATQEGLADWITDRNARQPAGARARRTYADPLFHYPNFLAILEKLSLAADDRLLEVGCGGGAFLKLALDSGCRAAAIDHSPEMVELARAQNADALAAGRLDIRLGQAEELPFPDAAFTCAVMTGVLGFLAEPVQALAEVRRTLQPGGQFICLGSNSCLRGTPAAPEPIASRLRFYTDHELRQLGLQAGFDRAEVERLELERHARRVGIPEDQLSLFAGGGAPFLMAWRA